MNSYEAPSTDEDSKMGYLKYVHKLTVALVLENAHSASNAGVPPHVLL